MKRIAAVFLVLIFAAVGLAGCTAASQAAVYSDLSSLLAESEFTNFSLPTVLPSGFLQTGLTWEDQHTCRVIYMNGEREISFHAASKENDQRITAQIKKLPGQSLLEINGHAVAFYQEEVDLEGEGLMLWSQGDVVYSLGKVTPHEGAGMIYSMQSSSAVRNDPALGRPRQAYDSLEALQEAMEVSMPQPVSLADNYTFSHCYTVGEIIAVAEYTNGTDTLTYQAASTPLVYEPVLSTRTEKETFFSGTDHALTVELPYTQGSIRSDAHWEVNGVYYRLTCTGNVSREQILTLAREFCSWLETAQ